MNENQKIENDELISLYLDGEASVRQQTELKRLMQHDPSIAERMEALRQQQQILNTLPVENAPASLLEDIRSEMERKLILEDFSGGSQTVLATSHLFVRRLMTSAAMILLPLGLLALVVFQIMKPPPKGPADYTSVQDMVAGTESANDLSSAQAGIFSEMPFKGTLVFQTDKYMAVNGLVKQAIQKQGLLDQAFPNRTADVTSFQITASPQKIAELVDSLAAIRPACQKVALQVLNGDSPDGMIEIPDIQAKQIKMLAYEDSPDMFTRLASRYADANRKVDSLFAEKSQPQLDADGYPEPSIPTLAGTYDTMNRTVQLTIQVQRAANKSEPQQ